VSREGQKALRNVFGSFISEISRNSLINMLIHQPQHYQAYLDASTPYTTYRWVGSGVLLFVFFLRIFLAQGWYIGMTRLNP
jgi:hypothetical protein